MDSFGKFKNMYPRAAIKNALNPNHDLGVDLWGVNGRRISCYTNLTLPGGHQQHTYYFPASHYQPENRITLRAQEHINVDAPITILPGAHYEFKAGSSIELNGLVDVRSGATFVAEIEGCTKSAAKSAAVSPVYQFNKLPKRMELADEFATEQQTAWVPEPFLSAHPNPGTHTIGLRTDMEHPRSAQLIAADGRIVYDGPVVDMQLDISGIGTGVYILRLLGDGGTVRQTRILKQ